MTSLVNFDNVWFLNQLRPEEFMYSFWHRLSTSMQVPVSAAATSKVEGMYPGLLQPHLYQGLLERLETTSVYTPEEAMIYRRIIELPLRGVRQQPCPLHGTWAFTANVYFCVPANQLQHVDGGVMALDNFTANHHPFGAHHANFSMCARSATSFYLWGLWMQLQEMVHQRTPLGNQPLLHSALILVAVQLESPRLQQSLERNEVHFWNRNYVDYFLNAGAGWHFTMAEKESMRFYLVSPQLTSVMLATSLFVRAPRHQSMHPTSQHFRYMHLWLPKNSFRLLNHINSGDWKMPIELTLQRRPARL